MKTVFDNHMVAHVWAQQSQAEGKSHNGNYWFSGDTLYSYATPIARMVPGVNRPRVALVTVHRYSVTTQGKHIGPAHRAVGYRGFTVPFLGVTGGKHRLDSSDMSEVHSGNVAYLVQQFHDEAARLRRARTHILPQYIGERLNHLAGVVDDYCDAFGLVSPDLDADGVANEVVASHRAREALANSPANQAKRDAARALKARQLAALVAQWQAGEVSSGMLPVRTDHDGGALLRVRGDVLETSLGAQVPLAHAIKVFRFVANCRTQGKAWIADPAAPVRVGHFTVDSVFHDGSFRAGCHLINWPEIERVARIVGVIPPEVPQGSLAALSAT